MKINKKLFFSLSLIASLFITGCDDINKTSTVDTNFTQQNQKNSQINEFKQLISSTYNFSTGKISDDISKNIYVFFDPQCPHCNNLWFNAQNEVIKDLPIVWIPVAFLNDHSEPQAAIILGSENSVDTMNQNETLIKNGGTGLSQKIINPKFLEQVKQNNIAFDKTGAKGVPLLLKIDANNKINGASGELSPQLLKDFYEHKIK